LRLLREPGTSPASTIRPEAHRVLTVEHGSAQGEVPIGRGPDGLRVLRRALKRLERQTAPAHEHLMTPAWGGRGRDETPVGNGAAIIDHLRRARLPDPA
jgi:hypothetical protein